MSDHELPEEFCLFVSAARAGKLPRSVDVEIRGAIVSNVDINRTTLRIVEHYAGHNAAMRLGCEDALRSMMKASQW